MEWSATASRRIEEFHDRKEQHQEGVTEGNDEDEELEYAPDLLMDDDDLFLLEIPKPTLALPFQGVLRIKTGKVSA
jgi:hypothetical protein